MKETLISEKDLLMPLLRDHLVSYRLIEGLSNIGLDTLDYSLSLGDTIFAMMGFGSSAEDEKLFEKFLNWSEKVLVIEFTITEDKQLNDLCQDIYRKLKKQQKIRKLKTRKPPFHINHFY